MATPPSGPDAPLGGLVGDLFAGSSTTSAPEDGEFTQTDIIIIAVTASVAGIVLIASIIYGCVKRQAAISERKRNQKVREQRSRSNTARSRSNTERSRSNTVEQQPPTPVGGGGVVNEAFQADMVARL